MANLTRFFRGESIFSSMFRQKLNAIVDWINSQNNDEIARPPSEDSQESSTGAERWIKITGHDDDDGRTWLYDWQECEPDGEGGWLLGPINQDTILIEDGEIPYGQAKNGAEEIGGLTLTRPIKNGAVVRARITVRTNEDDEPVPRVVFSASNVERQFFAEITGFSAGYYSWTECYADGTAISGTDSPQSGSNAVNSYYGPSDLTHVVSNGKVVMMEHLASDVDPNLVGFCVPLDGENLPMVGDEMGYPAPATIPEIYPPYDPAENPVQVGGDGAWIEVWEVDDPESVTDPKERIRRIYHLEPSTAATDQEFNTCLAEVTDGGDPDGGAAGKIEFEDVLVGPDAMGHIFSAEPEETPSSIAAGIGLVINGSDKTAIIKHSNQGAVDNTYEMVVLATSGGVTIEGPAFDTDILGHVIANPSLNAFVNFLGDEWIDFAIGDPGEVLVTHKEAQADGGLAVAGSVVDITPGSAGGGGNIKWKMFNSYIDSKGHVKLDSSSTTEATLTAGNKLVVSGTGSSATIAYVDAASGVPADTESVVTDLTFSVVGSNLRIVMTKKMIQKTVDSYGKVTDITFGGATTSNLDVALENC